MYPMIHNENSGRMKSPLVRVHIPKLLFDRERICYSFEYVKGIVLGDEHCIFLVILRRRFSTNIDESKMIAVIFNSNILETFQGIVSCK